MSFKLAYMPLIVFFLIFVTNGCQENGWEHERVRPDAPDLSDPSGPVATSQREAKAMSYLLTKYPQTIETAPTVNGKSPFGVLISFAKLGEIAYCSVSHLTRRKVALASHCIKSDAKAVDLYFLFFDHNGKKLVTRGEKILHRGKPETADIALVLVDGRADSWDCVNGTIEDTAADRIKPLGESSHSVSIWGFDHGHKGSIRMMSFRERTCRLFRPVPMVKETTKAGAHDSWDFTKIYDTRVTFFMDSCSADTISGNSGALVTDSNDLKKVHGVFVGSYHLGKAWKEDHFRLAYRGSSGMFTELTESKDQILFDRGSSFDYLKALTPAVW